MFNHMYGKGVKKTGLDYSRTTADIISVVPPHSYDEVTKKAINPTSLPKFVVVGTKDINAQIQSYAKEADIYSILTRFAYSECSDFSIINKRPCVYADVVDLPDNLNDFTEMMDKYWANVKKTDKDLANALLSNMSMESITNLIDSKIKEQLAKKGDE